MTDCNFYNLNVKETYKQFFDVKIIFLLWLKDRIQQPLQGIKKLINVKKVTCGLFFN